MKKMLVGMAILAIAVMSQAQVSSKDETQKIPILSDLPMVGKLFTREAQDTQKIPILGELPYVGHLFTNQKPETAKIPILSDLPYIGNLFKKGITQPKKIPILGDLPILGKLFILQPNGNKNSENKDKKTGGN